MTKSYNDPATPIKLPLGSATHGADLTLEDGPLEVHRSVLPSGVRLLTEKVPGTRSASVGLWVAVGSRDEEKQQSGAAHFLEHLLFKGTKTRSAWDIAAAFDAVGGESNAATAKESTHYYARVLDEDAPMAVATLTDMVTSSVLRDEDVEMERTVIVDELAMSDDTPAEVAQEAFFLSAFGDTALGRPIGGTLDSVRSISGDQIRRLYQDKYAPGELVVTAAGNVDHAQLVEQVTTALEASDWARFRPGDPNPRRSNDPKHFGAPTEEIIERDIEQTHILVGGQWLPTGDPRRPVSTVLTTVLGGGVSSRLFQEIREKRGLAYTTYAFEVGFADAGVFGMYAGCAPGNAAEVEKIMWAQLEELAAGSLEQEEVDRAIGQLRGGLALGLEDSSSRMSRLGRSELQGQFISVDASLARIEAVSRDDVIEMAAQMLAVARARAVVSPRD